jgi:hypothetical protein
MSISLKSVIGLQRGGMLWDLPSEMSRVNASFSNSAELNSPKLHYTSLCDLMPPSPSARGRCPLTVATTDIEWCDISTVNFKDNLLKLAARAYLQPTGKQKASEIRFLNRIWKKFTSTKNSSLIRTIPAFLQQKAMAFRHFLHLHVSGLLHRLNPLSLRFLQIRPSKL